MTPTHQLAGKLGLAEQLKSAGISKTLVQKAYARLKDAGLLTSEFGNGTLVAQTRNVVDPATGPGVPQARMEHGEPPLPTDPLPDLPELDETHLREIWELWELWDAQDDEEPRPVPPVVPGAGLDPQADRAAQATDHLTDPSHLPYPPSLDIHDILNLLNPNGPTTATHPEPRHLP